jgi:hypothetical protein
MQLINGEVAFPACRRKLAPVSYRMVQDEAPRTAHPRPMVTAARYNSLDALANQRIVRGQGLPRHRDAIIECAARHLADDAHFAAQSW